MARIPSRRWHRFLHPKRIAIVGASPTRAETTMLLGNLQRSGFAGEIVPVNPTHKHLHGFACAASLRDVDDVDAAVLLVARDRVETVLDEAIEGQTGGVVVIAAGFRESGIPEWVAAEQRFATKARAAGMPLIGTNCLGVVSGPGNAAMSIGPWQRRAGPIGGVALVMQSGGVMSGARRYLEERLNAGVRWEFSLGNATAVGFAEVLDYLAEDTELTAVTLLIEEIRDPAGVREAINRLHERDVLVTAEIIGKSVGGQRAAMSHTGSLAAPYRIMRDFLRQVGLRDSESLNDALAAAAIRDRFGRHPTSGRGRLGVLGVSGGTAGLVTDLAAANGLTLPNPNPDAVREIAAVAPLIQTSNPVDIIGGAAHPEVMTAVVDTFLHHANFDVALYVPSQGLPVDIPPGHVAAIDSVIDAAAKHQVPLILTQVVNNHIDAERAAHLTDRPGVIVVPTVGEALAGIRIWSGIEPRPQETASQLDGDGTMDSGLVAPAHTEPALKKLLAAAGCDVPRSVLIRNSGNCPLPGDVPVAFQRSQLPYPVMVKGVSPSITHKTRAGLVWPNVSSLDMLLTSLDKLTQNAQTAGAELEAVFVEEMIGAGLDLVVSLFESRLGTTIMVGRGGVDVETSQNIRFVVMPLAPTDLDRLTRDIQLSVDSETLTDLIHRVYGVYQNAGLALLELNPVRFLSDGRAVVLDAVGR